ncbi:MAG: hypothetical protein EZS28_021865, partial [Streblomastix strix]
MSLDSSVASSYNSTSGAYTTDRSARSSTITLSKDFENKRRNSQGIIHVSEELKLPVDPTPENPPARLYESALYPYPQPNFLIDEAELSNGKLIGKGGYGEIYCGTYRGICVAWKIQKKGTSQSDSDSDQSIEFSEN